MKQSSCLRLCVLFLNLNFKRIIIHREKENQLLDYSADPIRITVDPIWGPNLKVEKLCFCAAILTE